jgi:hypothetical protein
MRKRARIESATTSDVSQGARARACSTSNKWEAWSAWDSGAVLIAIWAYAILNC